MSATRAAAQEASKQTGRASVPAAALAALAEAGLIFLPLQYVALNTSLSARGGPFDSFVVFLVLFSASVAAATAARKASLLPWVAVGTAVGVGFAQGRWWGSGGADAVLIAVGLALAVALRAITLALRDWRDPIHVSFGVGAVLLLAEVAMRPDPRWAALLPWVIALFFVGSLGSRAASMHVGEEVTPGATDRARWLAMGSVLVASTLCVIAAAGVLGTDRGILEAIGRYVGLALYGFLYVASAVLLTILRPLGWLADAVGFEFGNIQLALERLGDRFSPDAASEQFSEEGGSDLWRRLLGLILLASIAMLLVVLILRRRRDLRSDPRLLPQREEATALHRGGRARGRRSRRRPRGELPDDTVRRWYAEVLLEFQRRGSVRRRTATPEEFLAEVRQRHPECVPSLAPLTRAYEDVRYGAKVMDASRLDTLEAHRDILIGHLSRAARAQSGGQNDPEP